MPRTPILFSLVAVLSVALSSCAPAPKGAAVTAAPATSGPKLDEPPIPLIVGFANYVSNAPVYIAAKEGFFEEEGVKVELVTLGSNEMYPALIAGQIDVAPFALSAAIFNAAAEGAHVKIVAEKGFNDPNACSADSIMASSAAFSKGLADASTLKGMTVSATPGLTGNYAVDTLLAQGGLSPSDITYVKINENAAKVEALRSGSIDLVSLGEPWLTYAVRQGAGEVWMRFSDVFPNASVAAIVYGPNILDDNPEAGVRFMAGYMRGVLQFREGKTDRNLELVAEYTQLPLEDLREVCWNSFRVDAIPDLESLLSYQEWLVDTGLVAEALPLGDFWTDEFLKAATLRLGY